MPFPMSVGGELLLKTSQCAIDGHARTAGADVGGGLDPGEDALETKVSTLK